MRRGYILGAVLALSLSRPMLCQTYTINALSAAGLPAGQIGLDILLTPKGSAQSVIPPLTSVQEGTLWEVKVYQKNLSVPPSIMVTAVNPVSQADYAVTGRLILATSATSSIDPHTNKLLSSVKVTFSAGGAEATALLPAAPSASAAKAAGATTGCTAGATTPQGPPGASYFNYCISGIWVPQEGSHPLYTTNSNFAVAHKLGPGSFGVRAQEAADSSVVLDPNTFSSAVFFDDVIADHTPVPDLMGVIFNWNLATVEFDRKKKNTNLGTNVNLITAPGFVFPFDLGHGMGIELDTGVEAGHNYKNNINPNGFGTVFRGLLGAQAGKIFSPKKPLKALKQIKWTSQYQVRLLADDEVITKGVHGKLVPYEGHQARNYASTEFDFMLTSNFGITLKHDYGALPPGYVFIENRASFGFTLQSAQK
jgi:hypothetical protein